VSALQDTPKERHKKFFAFQYNDTAWNARAWANALVITEQHLQQLWRVLFLGAPWNPCHCTEEGRS
jgi:hypothetical protein